MTLTFLRAPGSNPQTATKVVTVPATSRFNVTVGAGTLVPELTNDSFAALISSTQPIAVERAVYMNANGVVWAAGTNATATRSAVAILSCVLHRSTHMKMHRFADARPRWRGADWRL